MEETNPPKRRVTLAVLLDVEVVDPAWTKETLLENVPDFILTFDQELAAAQADYEINARTDNVPYRFRDVTVYTRESLMRHSATAPDDIENDDAFEAFCDVQTSLAEWGEDTV